MLTDPSFCELRTIRSLTGVIGWKTGLLRICNRRLPAERRTARDARRTARTIGTGVLLEEREFFQSVSGIDRFRSLTKLSLASAQQSWAERGRKSFDGNSSGLSRSSYASGLRLHRVARKLICENKLESLIRPLKKQGNQQWSSLRI